MGAQFFKTEQGGEVVILDRAEYDRLVADDDAREEAGLIELAEKSRAAVAAGEDVVLPAKVWDAIEAGNNPIAVLRAHRGLTQGDLAGELKTSQSYVSDLEKGKSQPGITTLVGLARALEVPAAILLEMLVPEETFQTNIYVKPIPTQEAPFAPGGFQTHVGEMRAPTKRG